MIKLLLLASSAQALPAAKNGIIEMDVEVSSRKSKGYTPGLGQELMNLNAGSSYIEKDVLDFFDIQIYSKLYIGSDRQEFEMTFDSGSGWVWVQTSVCQHGTSNAAKFNTFSTSTYR